MAAPFQGVKRAMTERTGGENSVFIEENAPRDGIQNESTPFTLDERVALVNALSACGFPRIQIGSFVNPDRVPQMAHTEELFHRIEHYPGVTYSALVLNEKGLERALACRMEHISVFVSASESHSRKNSNCSVDESLRRCRGLVDKAKSHGMKVQAGVMNAFGCRFEGMVPPERVTGILETFQECQVDEINLADTAGLANPKQIQALISRVRGVCDLPLSLHLHDTYGFALANVYAAWSLGISRFDACCGGLGGCPFIPGAAGNVATEDVVHLFESMGIPMGVSLVQVGKIVLDLEKKLGRLLPGRYARSLCCS